MLVVGVEEEDALHKVLVEHAWVSGQQQLEQTELGKAAHIWVHQRAHHMEEQGTLPLDVIFLEKPGKTRERLLPHQQRFVLESRGDGGEVRIHSGGVADS